MQAACQVSSHILFSLYTEWLSLNSWYIFFVNHHIQIGAGVHTPSNLMVLECLPLPFIVNIWKCVQFIHHLLYVVLHVCTQTVLPFMCNLNRMASSGYFNLQSYCTVVLLLYISD
jgi:hypothetical protein